MHHLLAPSCSPTKGGPPPPQCPSSSGLWSPGLLQNSSQVVSDRSPEELKMGSIERQESFDDNGDLINLADDIVVVEAPTLTSEEMDRARREALEVLRNNTPEEALRIFTQGLRNNVVINVAVPPRSGDGEPKTAPPPPKN
ncbi:hypothetical protein GUJ93_ZPchr0014g47275 [Zizania palustris]|uniref:Uncharacterized protein n=1 Tax=Zizania palustris TaxID=103762 RepID=A0A8J5W6S2_ZIZPA|nr:hypothetical protein GUJ93_ZPchr0014g47275 [Zizania palustris]